MVAALKQLGTPPVTDPSSWQTGLEDWDQAVELFGVGTQDWLVNMQAGAREFKNVGIQACGAIVD